ncbi:hypothetical protein SAMN05421736_101596 [Evansella caseinilytica]|uniref:Endospore appendages core domain-containing protein n=1 Tax=Evansella caseinilytica TaxID=1503961 RepID=A0A1H3HS54_9BACI|nr:S-Ena type endospore appendage [Evansella caseinilytica]SDY18250.1 hypothetical protein SAMN05421736_101596 [Evansella caseinilytica]
MSCNDKCCSPKYLTNVVSHSWRGQEGPLFPYLSEQLTAVTGYVLNNGSSNGSVLVQFLRGGIAGTPLPFQLTVEPGEYKSFTIVGIDAVRIDPDNNAATGELNMAINFHI